MFQPVVRPHEDDTRRCVFPGQYSLSPSLSLSPAGPSQRQQYVPDSRCRLSGRCSNHLRCWRPAANVAIVFVISPIGMYYLCCYSSWALRVPVLLHARVALIYRYTWYMGTYYCHFIFIF